MKKIVALILALSCIFAMSSCFFNKEEDPDKAFFDIVAATKPTEIKTLTYYTEEGKDPFNGKFETTVLNDSGDFIFKYTYTRIATFEDVGAEGVVIDGNIASVSGMVYCKNGKYSTDGETWFSEVPSTIGNQPKLNLERSKLGEYVMNDARTTLTATLTPDEAAEILGMYIDATSDITLVVSTNGSYLTRVSVSYEKDGASVTVNTSYS